MPNAYPLFIFIFYSHEEFEEIDTTSNKPKLELKENVSLLDRGKGIKKQVKQLEMQLI
jgi:hypothetical protein